MGGGLRIGCGGSISFGHEREEIYILFMIACNDIFFTFALHEDWHNKGRGYVCVFC